MEDEGHGEGFEGASLLDDAEEILGSGDEARAGRSAPEDLDELVSPSSPVNASRLNQSSERSTRDRSLLQEPNRGIEQDANFLNDRDNTNRPVRNRSSPRTADEVDSDAFGPSAELESINSDTDDKQDEEVPGTSQPRRPYIAPKTSARGRRVRFGHDDIDSDMGDYESSREEMLAAQLGAWGHMFVTFSSIGIGLYIGSQVFQVEFDRFLGMVLLFGLGLLALRPKYNPRFSKKIEHGMSKAEVETIRTFVKKRVELLSADVNHRDGSMSALKRSSQSYSQDVGFGSFRRRAPSRDPYQESRPQHYYPKPQSFESMLNFDPEEDGVMF
eukprot:CAMPEP_0184526490 /NCGR_PEP_ID=MMETSP0198_2-20121128/10682_1 /TAXON_ID=1112570 /ORGANISM="Thraustochytrium sp., Strain LLF1b" /LENGTH=328 /DNA_ID=CAMNT_0026918065 /DNA_START=111 /DNA_END=1097 /DNA_ORIENTATION=-